MAEDAHKPRKLLARIVAMTALLGLYLGTSLGMTGIVLTASTPAAAQRANRGKRGQGQGQAQGGQQFQNRPQQQPHKKNKAAKIIGTINAVGAVLAPFVAPPPRVVDEPYRRHRRRRRRGDDW
jgi:hypothetical protein